MINYKEIKKALKYYIWICFLWNFNSCGLKISQKPIVYVDATSFSSQEKFQEHWNMYYPWGTDHNGTARMYAENIKIGNDSILTITSKHIHNQTEGNSTADPHLKIAFHSGAIHAKQQIKVTERLPYWEVSGDFKTPTTPSSWPAFWLTGVHSWPPEIDILEFKGNGINWMNTVTGLSWDKTIWTTEKTNVEDATTKWHNYKLVLERVDQQNTRVKMYLDGALKTAEVKDFTGKSFWLIINMQMEGASGFTNDDAIARKVPQVFQAKNIYVAAIPAS